MNFPLIHLSSNLPNYPQEYHFAGIAYFSSPRHEHIERVRDSDVRAHCTPLAAAEHIKLVVLHAPRNIQNGCFKVVVSTSEVPWLYRG